MVRITHYGGLRHGRFNASLVALLAMLAMSVQCAHQVPPTGGPADKAPPSVAITTPLAGSTLADRNGDITLTFSEWIAPQRPERSVAVFPPPPKGYDVRVKGKSLVIRPRAALAESTTYHVAVTSALSDLRGNSIGTPFNLVFSTGPALDSARVSGCVIDAVKRVVQAKVALIRTEPERADSALFAPPSYLAQADSAGVFSIEHVRPGEYELVAFEDANADNRLQPGREQAYAAQVRRITVDQTARQWELYPVASDTSVRRIVSVVPLSSRLLSGTWNRRLPLSASGQDPALRVVSSDSARHSPRIERYVARGPSAFVIVLAEPLRLSPYQLHFSVVPFVKLPDSVTTADSIRFNGVSFADTLRPRLAASPTLARAELQPRLAMVWSEPVRVRGRIALADTLGDTVRLLLDSTFSDTTVMTPVRRLRPGTVYTARLEPTSVQDLSGLSPADTVPVMIRVNTIEADSLCLRLSGGTTCLPADPRRHWELRPARIGPAFYCPDNKGQFRFDSIPGTLGLLGYFSDRNGNRRPDVGELVPWTAPEPYVPLYDTIEARARWDVDNVPVKGCVACERGQKPPIAKPAPKAGSKKR